MNNTHYSKFTKKIDSTYLNRLVTLDLYLPTSLDSSIQYETLLIHDGQEVPHLHVQHLLNHPAKYQLTKHFLVVAVHTSDNRINEYGVIDLPDYKNRGNKATAFRDFLFNELIPALNDENPLLFLPKHTHIAGFSLSGLAAFDLAISYPLFFKTCGVFSGSFWWRKKAYEDGYDDENDRIMHNKVKKMKKEALKFWFECGTNDETEDRNNNGIIDSIEDTLDVIKELKKIGYSEEDITYVEIENGEHNFQTWSKIFPVFMNWICNQK